jgi:hypothetical protein
MIPFGCKGREVRQSRREYHHRDRKNAKQLGRRQMRAEAQAVITTSLPMHNLRTTARIAHGHDVPGTKNYPSLDK